jgi:hypothetical protein
MNIKTKYDKGNDVWFIYDNRVQHDEVLSIRIEIPGFGKPIKEEYQLFSPSRIWMDADNLFPTKQDLLNSL